MANRCIFMSEYVANSELEDFASAHGNAVVAKPRPIDELREAMSRLIEVDQPQQ